GAVPRDGQWPRRLRSAHRGRRAVLLAGDPRRGLPLAHLHLDPRQRHRGRRLHRPHPCCGAPMKPPSLTIGIEEEYQIIDPETRELRSYITEILQEDSVMLGEIKP